MPSQTQIPKGWQMVRLGDVCAPPMYGASAPARPFDPELPRYVRITDITDEGRLRIYEARSAESEKVAGYELFDGDLLFARSGSVGRTYLYKPDDGPCVFAGYLIRFRPDPKAALPRFVELYTHSISYQHWIASILRVGAQPNINATEYSSLPLLLPPLPEQQAIAAVLDSIDEAIEGTEAVTAATQQLRDSLLHQLLTHGVPGWHTEWKEAPGLGTIPAGWEVVRLGEVAEVNPKRPRLTVATDTPVTFLPMSAIAENAQGIIARELRPYAEVSTGYTYFEENDLLFSKITPCLQNGKHTLAKGLEEGFGFGTTEFHVVRADARLVAPYLFRVLTQTHIIERCAKSFTGTAGQQRIQPETLKDLPISLPPLPEQQAIAAVLDGVDGAIEHSRRETNMLKSLKDSTADALLTGRVRVRGCLTKKEFPIDAANKFRKRG